MWVKTHRLHFKGSLSLLLEKIVLESMECHLYSYWSSEDLLLEEGEGGGGGPLQG